MSITAIKKNTKNDIPPTSDVFTVFTYSPISAKEANGNEIQSGLDFILSHLEEPLFLRKISTYKSRQNNNQFQFLVKTKEEIMNSFVDSDFVDCRINAYPYLIEYKGIQRYKPNFIFMDIDRDNFKTERAFKLALSKTLKNIQEKLDGYPTVLWSGNGYHILQPVDCPTALEYVTEFKEFDRPSEQFLRFAKDYLSNNKADKSNYPSFRSCLLRIPRSINSKNNSYVKIIQKWNGHRPPVTLELLEEFRTWLIQKKLDEYNLRQKILQSRKKYHVTNPNYNYYSWIEKVLETPFEDCRKIITSLILAPYLINIKQLSYDESYQIIREWLLVKCDSVKKLDSNSNFFPYRISSALKQAMNKGIGPMSLEKIKNDNTYEELHKLLKGKGIMK